MVPALILDDETSWPSELRQILEEGLPILHAFCDEDARIEQLQRDDVVLRVHEPHNPYRHRKEEIYDAVGQSLAGLAIVGWHCTRLCDDEIEVVLRDGMYPLSPETLAARLGRRVWAGDISSAAAKRFTSEHQAHNRHRQMLWFIFSRGSLQCESGVNRLFTSWGGEALYVGHERDDYTGPILRSIGEPCIIEAELPIRKIEAHWDPAEWIARAFLHRRGISDGHSPERDGYIRETIGPERIRRVIQFSDPDFEVFTRASGWRTPLRAGGT
jgi:hypothetical protein